MNNTELLRRHTRIGLMLPIAFPLLFTGLAYLSEAGGIPSLIPHTDWLLMAFAIVVGSIYVGGIPYAIFLLFAWQFSKRPSFKQIYLFLVLSPLLFFVLQLVFLLIYDVYETLMHNRTYDFAQQLGRRAALSAFVFPIAYSYIALTLIAFHLRVRTMSYPQQATGGYDDH